MNSDLTSFQLLENALRAAQLRQQVYSNNIANIDTPGYKRQDVQFENVLQDALQRTVVPTPSGAQGAVGFPQSLNWTAAVSVQPTVVQDSSTVVDNNGNNVDVDAEMSKLAENQIQYNALIQDVQSRLARLRTAINGG